MIGGLTRTQLGLLTFIRTYTAENGGVSPSIEEMRVALGLESKSTVHRIMIELRERGAVDWIDGGRRTVRVLGEFRDPYAFETLTAQTDGALSEMVRHATSILKLRAVARNPSA